MVWVDIVGSKPQQCTQCLLSLRTEKKKHACSLYRKNEFCGGEKERKSISGHVITWQQSSLSQAPVILFLWDLIQVILDSNKYVVRSPLNSIPVNTCSECMLGLLTTGDKSLKPKTCQCSYVKHTSGLFFFFSLMQT